MMLESPDAYPQNADWLANAPHPAGTKTSGDLDHLIATGQTLLPTVSQEKMIDSTSLTETAVDRMLAKFRELFSLP